MDSDTVLYIGRAGNHAESLLESLKKSHPVKSASSGRGALDVMAGHKPRAIVLDAASMRTPGERVCRSLRESYPTTPIIHIITPEMQLDGNPADLVLKTPLTGRRLKSQLNRLLNQGKDVLITRGPYTLNVTRRLLMVYGKETQLSPKIALLIEYFMQHANETLDRKTLMEAIWKTDYLGDTRTLDVHIRWVREVLEESGKYERTLKTVRKVGYRFEPPAAAFNE